MIDQLTTWAIAVPVGAILGWIGSRLFGPTVDALGVALLDKLSLVINRNRIARKTYEELEQLVIQNHVTNRHTRFNERKTYLQDRALVAFLANHGSFMRHAIKKTWIEQAVINSYDQSDVFFAGMEILFNQLAKADVQKIFEKFKDNDQAALWPFLETIAQRKPRLLSPDASAYLKKHQLEWNEWQKEKEKAQVTFNPEL